MYFFPRFIFYNNKDSNDSKSPVDACNYGKNKNMPDPYFELCKIDNSNDFHQALTNAVITYVASLYDNFSMSEDGIQKVIDCHKTLLGAGFLMIKKNMFLNYWTKPKCKKKFLFIK